MRVRRLARAVTVAVALAGAAAPLGAQGASGLLPGDHWAVEAVWRLEELGLVRGFVPAQRAVPISAVAAALEEARGRAPAARRELVEGWYDRFAAEFGGALRTLESPGGLSLDEASASAWWESAVGRVAPGRGEFAPDRTGAARLPNVDNAVAGLAVAASYGGRASLQLQGRGEMRRARLGVAELTLRAGAMTLSAGRQSVGYGWAERGGLVLSGAVPVDRVELATGRPLRAPWLLRHLGPVALHAFAGPLRGDRHTENPWFWGGRIAVQPHPRFTVAVHRAAMFGGDSSEVRVTARTILDMLIGDITGGSFENQVVAVAGRLRLPTERVVPLTAYLEWGAEDAAGALRDVPGRVIGLRAPAVPGVEEWSLGVELAHFEPSCCGNPEWYRHHAFDGAWSGEEVPLGHRLGGNGEELAVHSALLLHGGRLRLEGEWFRRDREAQNLYVPGRAGESYGGRVAGDWRPTPFAELFAVLSREQGRRWSESSIDAGGRVFLGAIR